MHKDKDYIIVKDRHPRISEVKNDCVNLCVPASRGESLAAILQKMCSKFTTRDSQLTELIETLQTEVDLIETQSTDYQDQIDDLQEQINDLQDQIDNLEEPPVTASGFWTPTTTPLQGIASIQSVPCLYSRVGNMVTITGRFVVDVNAIGDKIWQFSLPIASNFTTGEDLTGSISSYAVDGFGYVTCDVNANEGFVLFSNNSVSDVTVYFSAQYIIL